MKPIKLKIETKTQKYPIIIGSNLIIRILNKNTSKEEKLLLIPILIILWPFVPTMSFFSFVTKCASHISAKKILIIILATNP